jgi:hypothetical protein
MLRGFLLLTLLTTTAPLTVTAQWTLQDAHTTADLRGIDNVGGGVAWASGSNGTILRTEDAGFVWQLCTKPPGGEHLDFRGVQGIDNNTAIIMSIGKGDQSRLYKTTDGCQTWHLLFTNPDPDGFFDALKFQTPPKDRVPHPYAQRTGGPSRAAAREPDQRIGFLLGDPVNGEYKLFCTSGNDQEWSDGCSQDSFRANKDGGVFAASNSSLSVLTDENLCFVTGGSPPEMICQRNGIYAAHGKIIKGNRYVALPLAAGSSAGAFSIQRSNRLSFPVVGGDYQKPNDTSGTAAFTTDGGKTWLPATTPPHGFRSAVAYDAATKTWITVGPNGTDISTDDGRNWRALHPDPRFNEPPDTDQHWNALSLPYVVGPHGRIATLRPSALQPATR